MLKHLWSLAVEEQFYIFWPAIALFAYRWRGARAVGLVALGGALLSTLAMTIGSFVGDMPGAADPSRLYFGTDTHAMGVFVGAALAVVWRPGRTSPVLPRQARMVITGAGVAGLLLLVVMFTDARGVLDLPLPRRVPRRGARLGRGRGCGQPPGRAVRHVAGHAADALGR